jgi:hypothetical protein
VGEICLTLNTVSNPAGNIVSSLQALRMKIKLHPLGLNELLDPALMSEILCLNNNTLRLCRILGSGSFSMLNKDGDFSLCVLSHRLIPSRLLNYP